ncbi:WzyE family oligosaccharide polymerase [Shigella flexneri]
MLNNHSGLAISATLIKATGGDGRRVVHPCSGRLWFKLIIKWFDWLYELGS